MTQEEDWLLRPVLRGMCKFESLKDCTLTLADVAIMNDAIDCEEENRTRISKAVNSGR